MTHSYAGYSSAGPAAENTGPESGEPIHFRVQDRRRLRACRFGFGGHLGAVYQIVIGWPDDAMLDDVGRSLFTTSSIVR